MENLHLRAILLKVQDRISDDDRKRLHFFLGNDVPRRIRDNPTLGGTLSLLESLFDQDKINEDDLTFLIDAFDEIQCTDAVKLLKAHTKRMQSNDINQSVHSLSSLMPSLSVFLDNDKYSTEIGLLHQTKDSVSDGTMLINENVKDSPVTVFVNNEKRSFSSLKPKQLPSFLSLTQQSLVVFILLSIVLAGFLISYAMKNKNLTAEYNNITKENTNCRGKVRDLKQRQTTDNEVIQNLTKKIQYLERKPFTNQCSIRRSADANANVKTKQLLAYITGLPEQGKILSGQFADYSPDTFNTDQIDKIFKKTGQVPAILGCDYVCGSKRKVPSENIIDYSCNSALKDHWNKSGLVTVSMCLPNFVSPIGGGYDNRMNLSFVDLTNSQTESGKRWHLLLDRIAEGLTDLQGAGVTVLYHPLLKMNGDWLYWSNKDPKIFREVWLNMFDYFTSNKSLHNILWVFSPPSRSDPKNYYPGHPHVDIVALDVYTDDPNSTKDYEEMIKFDRPFALGEVGPKTRNGQFDYTKWMTAIQSKFRQFSYFLARNNDWSPSKNQNANIFFNNKTIINRGNFDFNKEIIFPSNEALYHFPNDIGNWIGTNVDGSLYPSTQVMFNSTISLGANINLIENKQYSLYTRKLPFNVSGRKRLTAYSRVAPWGFRNNGQMKAKFYLIIGSKWRDEGEVQLNDNTATAMLLNLCQLLPTEYNDISEIGVLFTSTAEGGRSAIYLSSIFVE